METVDVVSLPTALGHANFIAPEVPAERVAALRAAYAATMADPDFLAEAAKLNMQVQPQDGRQVNALVRQVAAIPKPVLERTARLLGWRKD